MLLAPCHEPHPSQFSPQLQVRVINTSNILKTVFSHLNKIAQQMITRKKWKVVPKQELFQVLSQVHSHIIFSKRTANYGKVASRNYAETSRKLVNTSIPCTDQLDGKMSPLYPNMLLGKNNTIMLE